MEKIKEELLNGLYGDGGHHKQYHLAEAFKLLFGEEEYEKERWEINDRGEKWEKWEEGIP